MLDPASHIVAALISFARVSIGPRPGRLNCPIVSALNASGEMSVGSDNATIMSAVILRIGTGAVNRYEKLAN